MAKTRSQSVNSTIKKEEREDKPKLEQTLHGTNNASRTRSKVTKNRKPIQAQITKVKSENDDDNKALLALEKKKTFRRLNITAEQIAKLISYIVNNKMSVLAAARKVGISQGAAQRYYGTYRNDPEHKIPLPKTGVNRRPSTATQQQIDDLIRYIVNDGMNITQAAKKADMVGSTAIKYYAKYLEDPERKIPLLDEHTGNSSKRCTQEEVADLIGYIVCDKMSLAKASKKANMSPTTGTKYYLKYLHDPNHEIPDPHESSQLSLKCCTNDQVKSLIEYVNDGMSLLEASVKSHMAENTASKYYKQYLDDPERNIPTPETSNIRKPSKPPTLDQMKNFFCYIIVDKLSVAQAADKAKIERSSGQRYYKKYLKNPNNQIKTKNMTYSVEKMKQFVVLVQNEKMNLSKAADTVHLGREIARKYYNYYLKDPQNEFPTNKNKWYTQEDMKTLIDYIDRDKMSVPSAARRIKMNPKTAKKYYKKYQNDPEHRIPVPAIRGHTKKIRTLDKYAKMIADIYKNNPSVKPRYGNHHPEMDVLDIEIKDESEEEDDKTPLKKTVNS